MTINDDLNIGNFLSRHRRAINSSSSNFDVRLEIPIVRELISNSKTISLNDNDKLDVIDIIENEALFNNLFNLEQVKFKLKKYIFFLDFSIWKTRFKHILYKKLFSMQIRSSFSERCLR